jgi:hypothetical protein
MRLVYQRIQHEVLVAKAFWRFDPEVEPAQSLPKGRVRRIWFSGLLFLGHFIYQPKDTVAMLNGVVPDKDELGREAESCFPGQAGAEKPRGGI